VWCLDRYKFIDFVPSRFSEPIHQIPQDEVAMFANGNQLVLQSVAHDLDDRGHFNLDPGITHFTLALNSGHQLADLFSSIPTQFVIGIETNPFLASMLRHTSLKYNAQSSEGKRHPYCENIPEPLQSQATAVGKHPHHFLSLNAFAAPGRSNVFEEVLVPNGKAMVQRMPLSAVLQHVPPSLTWVSGVAVQSHCESTASQLLPFCLSFPTPPPVLIVLGTWWWCAPLWHAPGLTINQ
jgi:hypothetical protein